MTRKLNKLIPICTAMAEQVAKHPHLHAVSFWRVTHDGMPSYAAIMLSQLKGAPDMYSVRAVTDLLGLGAPVTMPLLLDKGRLFADQHVINSIAHSRMNGPLPRSITDVIFASESAKVDIAGVGMATITLHRPEQATACVAGQAPFAEWPLTQAIKRETRRMG